MLTDGPHGLRKQAGAADHLGLNASVPATCFPTAATVASSWDVGHVRATSVRLGAQATAEDVSVLLGPGLNYQEQPAGGELAAAFTQGVQTGGVAACPKHFAVNSQEAHRMSVGEIVDDRALHEIYLEGFRRAVTQADPCTLMTSYNRVNGTYTNEHEELLHEMLRGGAQRPAHHRVLARIQPPRGRLIGVAQACLSTRGLGGDDDPISGLGRGG